MILGVASKVLSTMLQGILELAGILASFPWRIHFIAVWFVGFLYLLFNAPTVYGDHAVTMQLLLLLYMSALGFVYGQTHETNPLMEISTAEFVLRFGFAGAIAAFALSSFGSFVPTEQQFLTRESVGTLLTHAWVVAIGEELLFRNAFPGLLTLWGSPPMAAQTISAGAFAIMHWTAYGGSVPNILFAGLLGLFLGAIVVRLRGGIVIAMSIHFAYNAFVLGYIT